MGTENILIKSEVKIGKNNQTIILNILDIAKQVGINPESIIQYMSNVLNRHGDVNNGNFSITGVHSPEILQILLEKFFKDYKVSCPNCQCYIKLKKSND